MHGPVMWYIISPVLANISPRPVHAVFDQPYSVQDTTSNHKVALYSCAKHVISVRAHSHVDELVLEFCKWLSREKEGM